MAKDFYKVCLDFWHRLYINTWFILCHKSNARYKPSIFRRHDIAIEEFFHPFIDFSKTVQLFPYLLLVGYGHLRVSENPYWVRLSRTRYRFSITHKFPNLTNWSNDTNLSDFPVVSFGWSEVSYPTTPPIKPLQLFHCPLINSY